MECISCDDPGAFNRVVVNQVSGRELALFCESCEADAFGSLLDEPAFHQDRGCAFCDGSGQYVVPELDCLILDDGGDLRAVEYTVDDDTVALCADHLAELIPDDVSLPEVLAGESPTATRLGA